MNAYDYSGLVSFARSCHPIGLINAGDVQGAITDVFEVGRQGRVDTRTCGIGNMPGRA